MDPLFREKAMVLTPEEVKERATKAAEAGSAASSWLFGLGLFFFIIGILFLFLLRRKWRWIAYGFILLGLIFMIGAACLYAFNGGDRYCSKNPGDSFCGSRYEDEMMTK